VSGSDKPSGNANRSGSKAPSGTPAPTSAQASSVREHAPKLPEPERRTGDLTADALLDTRDHVAQAAHVADAARAAAANVDPDTLANSVSARVAGTVKGEARGAAQNASTAAKDAKAAANEARQAAQAVAATTPPAKARFLASALVAAAVVIGAAGGWIARDHAVLGSLPTCTHKPQTFDDGTVFCVIEDG